MPAAPGKVQGSDGRVRQYGRFNRNFSGWFAELGKALAAAVGNDPKDHAEDSAATLVSCSLDRGNDLILQ